VAGLLRWLLSFLIIHNINDDPLFPRDVRPRSNGALIPLLIADRQSSHDGHGCSCRCGINRIRAAIPVGGCVGFRHGVPPPDALRWGYRPRRADPGAVRADRSRKGPIVGGARERPIHPRHTRPLLVAALGAPAPSPPTRPQLPRSSPSPQRAAARPSSRRGRTAISGSPSGAVRRSAYSSHRPPSPPSPRSAAPPTPSRASRSPAATSPPTPPSSSTAPPPSPTSITPPASPPMPPRTAPARSMSPSTPAVRRRRCMASPTARPAPRPQPVRRDRRAVIPIRCPRRAAGRLAACRTPRRRRIIAVDQFDIAERPLHRDGRDGSLPRAVGGEGRAGITPTIDR
jgi:hypothetical protein